MIRSSRGSVPIYEQIKENLRTLIISGGVGPGDRLPSVREMAAELAINPNTIQRAYHELEAEGYLITLPGKGSFAAQSGEADEARKAALWQTLDSAAAELRFLGVTDGELTQRLKEAAHD